MKRVAVQMLGKPRVKSRGEEVDRMLVLDTMVREYAGAAYGPWIIQSFAKLSNVSKEERKTEGKQAKTTGGREGYREDKGL